MSNTYVQPMNNTNWLKTAWPWIVCGIAALFYCYEYLLRIFPGTMVPQLQHAFGINGIQLDAVQISVLSAFYYYAYSPMQLPVGIMMDRYGPRWMLTLAVVTCAMGTLTFAATNSLIVAQAGRFMMGFGSAFAFVGVLKLAANWLPPNRFAFMAGMTTASGMFFAMFGTSWISVFNADPQFGWQKTIFGLGCFGFLLIPIIWLIVRDAPKGADSKDVVESSYSQLFRDVLTSFKNKQIWLNGLIGCFMMAPTVVFAELWGEQYLEHVHQFGTHEASKVVSMVFLGWALGGPTMGYFSDHIQKRKIPLMLGSFLCSVILTIFVISGQLSIFHASVLLFLMGFFSGAQIIVFAVGRENCHPSLAGTVVAVTNFIVVASALFQILAGYILHHFWTGAIVNGVQVYSKTENQLAMCILPLCSLVAFFLCFFLRETNCQPQHSDA